MRLARACLLLGPRRLQWVEEPLPEPRPGEVLVKTRTGAISVGSELAQYRGAERVSVPLCYPRMTGYESVGVVGTCGRSARVLRPGDRVIGRYGHRSHAVVPEDRLIPVPADVSDGVALLVILTCDVARGIGKVTPTPGEQVLIIGAGAIGCLTLWVLRRMGVDQVDVVEPLPERRALAVRLGARHACAPEAGATCEPAYTVGFMCADAPAGFAALQERMCMGGRVCVLSDGNGESLCLNPAFHERELSIVGSSDGSDYARHAAWYFSQPAAERDDLATLFDWAVPAAALVDTFRALAAGERTPLKVLVRYEAGWDPLS